MSLDYSSNDTGLADFNVEGSFVTHFIFRTFLLLFTIPIHVQAVNIYGRLCFHRWIRALLKYFINIFKHLLDYTIWPKSAKIGKNLHQRLIRYLDKHLHNPVSRNCAVLYCMATGQLRQLVYSMY